MEELLPRQRHVVAELKRRREQLRLQRRRNAWVPGDTPVTFRVALALQALAPAGETAATEYVRAAVGASRCRQDLSSPKFAVWLQEHENAGLDPVLSPSTDFGKRALRQAHTFLEERDLRNWAREANVTQRLAPKGRSVWREYCRRTESRVGEVRSTGPGVGDKTERTRKQWLRRWSRRWAVRRGKFKVGERLSAAQLQKKATIWRSPFRTPGAVHFSHRESTIARTFLASKVRPILVSQRQTLVRGRPKCETLLGPEIGQHA